VGLLSRCGLPLVTGRPAGRSLASVAAALGYFGRRKLLHLKELQDLFE
jgi:hypothetical protein